MGKKKILVLGGTGAMGVYVVPELLAIGYEVHVVSLDNLASENPNLTYIQADAKDDKYLAELLKNKYDAIIDFLIYLTPEFKARHELLMSNTDHYIFISTYRVYADKDKITTEKSPRLLDVCEDKEYLKEEEYALFKAREEDIIFNSKFKNWTILRPAVTYSKYRYQLTVLEAPVLVYRMMKGKKVLLPKEPLTVSGTMTWAGDVAKMMSRIVLNEKTLGEVYTISTAEHHTWGEIADYYKQISGLIYETADMDTFLNVMAPGNTYTRYQLVYDRMFNRIMDNSKILEVTGMKQSDFITLKEGLSLELNNLPKDYEWPYSDINERMDQYFEKHKS